MSSRRNDESVKLPAALTGLSLAISIAREATDAVPVVKQTLGAAVRILALAEKIDKDREALHALADRSLQLAQRVKDILDGRTPDEKILASFERINRAFGSIEAFMRKHTQRTRLHRAIGYVFTVPLHVERLSRELGDAVQELVLVALLDVNQEARETHALVAKNARYVGEFRLLRHCDIEKLEPVEYCWFLGDQVRYHRARVDGQLAVVRYFEETETQNSHIVRGKHQADYERTLSHDRIIMELSTVQRSHRNIARIYGWGQGSIHDRFTVFKSGFRDVFDLTNEVSDPLNTLLRCTVKVLDATTHLQQMGIYWDPITLHYYKLLLDYYLEPTIGLQNDLGHIDPKTKPMGETVYRAFWLAWPLYWTRWWKGTPTLCIQTALARCRTKELTDLLGKLGTIRGRRGVITKADCSRGWVLNDRPAEYLLWVLRKRVLANWQVECLFWADIMLALDRKRSHRLQNGYIVSYTAVEIGRDRLQIYGLAEDSEHIVFDLYLIYIPDVQCAEARKMFGIPAPPCCQELHVIATGSPGTYCAPE